MAPLLAPDALAAGYGLVHQPSVSSTMDEGRMYLMAGGSRPCWFVADEQTGGRGRHGRSWISPPGNLYATLALNSPCAPANAPELGFVAGLALHRSILKSTNLDNARLAIKWPNDLLLDGAKVAGLLLEGFHVEDQFAVLIGFGVNIVSAPTGLEYPARSLGGEAGMPSQSDVLFHLSASWLEAHALWKTGFGHVRAEWIKLASGIGQNVRVRPPTGDVRGIMRGLDERGRLLLDTPAGQMHLDAGDLFFGD